MGSASLHLAEGWVVYIAVCDLFTSGYLLIQTATYEDRGNSCLWMWKSDPLVKTQTTAVYEGTAGCAHKRQGTLRAAWDGRIVKNKTLMGSFSPSKWKNYHLKDFHGKLMDFHRCWWRRLSSTLWKYHKVTHRDGLILVAFNCLSFPNLYKIDL